MTFVVGVVGIQKKKRNQYLRSCKRIQNEKNDLKRKKKSYKKPYMMTNHLKKKKQKEFQRNLF